MLCPTTTLAAKAELKLPLRRRGERLCIDGATLGGGDGDGLVELSKKSVFVVPGLPPLDPLDDFFLRLDSRSPRARENGCV